MCGSDCRWGSLPPLAVDTFSVGNERAVRFIVVSPGQGLLLQQLYDVLGLVRALKLESFQPVDVFPLLPAPLVWGRCTGMTSLTRAHR